MCDQLTINEPSATLGCRLFAGCDRSGEVGCIVLAGEDFPDAIKDELERWKLSLILIACPNKLSTRGLLEYEEFGRECIFPPRAVADSRQIKSFVTQLHPLSLRLQT